MNKREKAFPKHTLDKLTANLINQKKDLIIQKLQDTAIQKGVHIKIDNICVENKTE